MISLLLDAEGVHPLSELPSESRKQILWTQLNAEHKLVLRLYTYRRELYPVLEVREVSYREGDPNRFATLFLPFVEQVCEAYKTELTAMGFPPHQFGTLDMAALYKAIEGHVREMCTILYPFDLRGLDDVPEFAAKMRLVIMNAFSPGTESHSSANDPRTLESLARRTAIDFLLGGCNYLRPEFKIVKKHIWLSAGHKTGRQFQHWQACDPKTTPSDNMKFGRIIKMSAQEFIDNLKKKNLLRKASQPDDMEALDNFQ